MIKNFIEIISVAQKRGPKKVAVAVAQDKEVLLSLNEAYKLGIVNPILIGNKNDIESIAKENNISIKGYEIINVEDKAESCKVAAQLVQRNEASMLMKGFVDTAIILKAVLNKKVNLFDKGSLLSHVGVLSISGYDRLFILSDSAMNIAPSLGEKVNIIKNAIKVANALENEEPKIALICAVEKVNKKMPATIDASELVKMNEKGEINGCIIGGPFALDNAVSINAAKHKGINHPVAGKADILITPNIESGNILNKSMEYFGNAQKAGIIMGAKVPIILTSRASSVESKLNSISLGVLISCIGGK